MKWTNHKLTAISTSMAMGFNLIETSAIIIGSFLPDWIEMAIAGRNKYIWEKIHRKYFHWWIPYLIIILSTSFFIEYYLVELARCLAIGAYIHILGDAMTVQGIPILNPNRCDLAMGYFKTGEDKEYKYTLIYVGIMAVIIITFTDFNMNQFITEDNKRLTIAIQSFLNSISYNLTH